MTVLIHGRGIKKHFNQVDVLKGVDFSFNAGESYAIQGASGSGKSTFLYLLGGLDRPSDGTLYWGEQSMLDMSDDELALLRNRSIGFVFQFHYLLPTMNAMDNILLPGRIGDGRGADQEEIKDLAEKLGVLNTLSKYPYELSGGELQRVNILRALSLHPKLLLCDEPTGNLDSVNSNIVTDLLLDLAQDYGAALIVVTHNNQITDKFSNHLLMTDGVIGKY